MTISGELRQETFALTRRWFLQLRRRPATLIVGVLQPLMWLLLFGALFRNAPATFFGEGQSYIQFLAAGIIVFTAFSGSLNAGLPLMFDREFGFLNRMLVAPLVSRFSIVLASAIFILTLSLVQTAAIMAVSALMGATLPNFSGLAIVVVVILLVVLNFTMLSLAVAFALPGHQEMLALIFLINLPLIFSSTALAPLDFMPPWLQWIASLNPLSFAIEPIRYVYSHSVWGWESILLQAPWGTLTMVKALLVLVGLASAIAWGIRGILRRGIA